MGNGTYQRCHEMTASEAGGLFKVHNVNIRSLKAARNVVQAGGPRTESFKS